MKLLRKFAIFMILAIPGSALRRRVVSSVLEVEDGGWWFGEVLTSPRDGFRVAKNSSPSCLSYQVVFKVMDGMLLLRIRVFDQRNYLLPLSQAVLPAK